MDYDELVSDIVKQVHVRYEDYVDYQKSEGLNVEPFDAMAEQMLDDELGDDAYVRFWTDCSKAFYEAVNPTILAMLENDHWND